HAASWFRIEFERAAGPVLAAGVVDEHAVERNRVVALEPFWVQVEREFRFPVGIHFHRTLATADLPTAKPGEGRGRDAVGERNQAFIVRQRCEFVLSWRA